MTERFTVSNYPHDTFELVCRIWWNKHDIYPNNYGICRMWNTIQTYAPDIDMLVCILRKADEQARETIQRYPGQCNDLHKDLDASKEFYQDVTDVSEYLLIRHTLKSWQTLGSFLAQKERERSEV